VEAVERLGEHRVEVEASEEALGVPGDARELLDRAEKESWAVSRLAQEAGQQKPPRPVPADPSPVSPDKALGQARKALGQVAALAAPSTLPAGCLVGSGIDAESAAEFTAARHARHSSGCSTRKLPTSSVSPSCVKVMGNW
jgi:hypothetical protein